MTKKLVHLFVLVGTALLSVGVIRIVNSHNHSHVIDEAFIDSNGILTEPIDIATHTENRAPEDEYEEGVALVKTINEIDLLDIDLKVTEYKELYPNSPWKKVSFKDCSTFDAVKYLRSTKLFDQVDYNYIMESEEEDVEYIDVSGNEYADQLSYIESNGVGHAWAWGHHKHNHGEKEIDAGGSPDIIIAVIDTGVDYNHIDLRDNIWTNTAEIPNNGIDDDDNGYRDDVRGWDCVNEDNDPMDDNGHGTHVAGIAAAQNNNIGTIGVAFNCKIMPIKAGNNKGSFTNTDVIRAIQYAYMNGASVINMSFGGATLSLALQDVLADAYSQCVLVAAAGNNGGCNQPNCKMHSFPAPFYPAAIPFVVGVMSCNADGSHISAFSNFDHAPYHYNQYEYDCYACGEQIISTWPGNKYAKLSGTSMSSPVVAGIAALLRSAYPDRETFSNKYIHSQLTNAGTIHPESNGTIDIYHPLCDAYEALTNVPTPHIYNLYRYYIFDNEEFSSNNNGDGFIDAGETIRLGIELQNRGGKATNVTAKIDTNINGNPNITDPYVNILNDSIHMDEIGTYSIQDGGKIYENDKVVNMTNAFEFVVDSSTFNGYTCGFNLHIEYYNALENDSVKYIGDCTFSLTISSGTRLSGTISADTTFTSNKLYRIDGLLRIIEGVTVNFEEGCILEFYGTNQSYIDTLYNSPSIEVYGTLNFNGTESNPIVVKVTDAFEGYIAFIETKGEDASINFYYSKVSSISINGSTNRHSGGILFKNSTYLTPQTLRGDRVETPLCYKNGAKKSNFLFDVFLHNVEDSYIDLRIHSIAAFNAVNISNSVIVKNAYRGGVHVLGSSIDTLYVMTPYYFYDDYKGGEIQLSIGVSSGYVRNQDELIFDNNTVIETFVVEKISDLPSFYINENPGYDVWTGKNNLFSKTYQDYSDALFTNNTKPDGKNKIEIDGGINHSDLSIWPYIKDISILDSNDNVVHTVGTEQNKVRVTFSREMDISSEFSLFYGSWEPYTDYKITGNYVSDTVWEGTLKVKANIEGGIQHFSSTGGCAKNDSFKTLINNAGAFTFNIDTSSAFAMNLQANPTEQGVELTWAQDDYDTLMGYNIYRSESKDGNYVRLNSSVIPVGENTFLDDSCEPGKTYWYTFTVVLSDFTESATAGKVSATSMDTVSPTIYHNPVNQGYANNNLVISCTASDNIAVQSTTLYYRTIGDENWKTLPMVKANDRFSATIFGSEVTMDGLEYYISVTDGRNVVTRGSAENPFTVIIKDPSLLNNLGDVDGDGSITTKDALMIMRFIGGQIMLTDDQFQRADLDKDGELMSYEALAILQYINGKITSLDL